MKRSRKSTTVISGTLVLVALLSASLTTLISAHVGNSSIIHSCVNNKSGTIKIVDADDSCNRNWDALSWNKYGQQGDPGVAGPQGDPAMSGYQVVSTDFTTVVNGEDLERVCPTGKVVIGGGAEVLGLALITASIPNADNTGWVARGLVPDPDMPGFDLKVHAICSYVTP